MKFVALISGGKDSIYSLMECLRNGHEIVACAHLQPQSSSDEESYMYQTAGSECITLQVEECLGLPLVTRKIRGRSQMLALVYNKQVNTDNLDTNETEPTDEVEDLYELLFEVKTRFPNITAVSSGAILSTYQRTRIESVCLRLNLTSLAYLWRIGSQKQLLQCMVDDGLEAVLVKVASPPGLNPTRHLNKSVKELLDSGLFDRLYQRFNFHICGEGGEYETLTLDCPLFRKRLVLTETEIIQSADGVGILKIHSCCTVDKDSYVSYEQFPLRSGKCLVERLNPSLNYVTECLKPIVDSTSRAELHHNNESTKLSMAHNQILPHIKYLSGGVASISEIFSPVVKRNELLESVSQPSISMAEARFEMTLILDILSQLLSSIHWPGTTDDIEKTTALDVVAVHLYLTSMSYFPIVNELYKNFFGTVLPPARSCLAVRSLPGGRKVMLTCLIQRGSGDYMRYDPSQTTIMSTFVRNEIMNSYSTQLRSTLNVQSISHWAPVCIGPYSQACTLRSGPIFLAGQIGLVPSSMKLSSSTLEEQLKQAWKNTAAIAEAVNSSLEVSFGALIYVDSKVVEQTCPSQTHKLWKTIESISQQIISNHRQNMCPSDESSFSGYEDEETWNEIQKTTKNVEDPKPDTGHDQSRMVPLMMVVISELPANALTEVETVCATSSCASALGMSYSYHRRDFVYKPNLVDEVWNICNDGSGTSRETMRTNLVEKICIHTALRSCGWCCFSNCFIVASMSPEVFPPSLVPALYFENLLGDMIMSGVKVMEKSGLCFDQVSHIRLFYVYSDGDDGSFIRLSLQSTLSRIWSINPSTRPTFSVIPVDLIKLSSEIDEFDHIFIAMQVGSLDLLHLKTELWINYRTRA